VVLRTHFAAGRVSLPKPSQCVPSLPASDPYEIDVELNMQFFHLEHPPDEMILCDREQCGGIADYLEIEDDGTERRLCGFHTCSDKYAVRLPQRTPSCQQRYRSKLMA
jgi:hypothetical protein